MSNVAALDCGSNSTRLLITDDQGNTLAREMRITRLSQGVDTTGNIETAAQERTFEALRAYRHIMDHFEVSDSLLVATSAVRDAANGEGFLQGAAGITGGAARILSGRDEATLSFRGATASLPPSTSLVTAIVDIGGGSTEIALECDGEVRGVSMQMGCVRLTERTLGSGIVTPQSAQATWDWIDNQLDHALPQLHLATCGPLRLVGLAGTVATVAQLTLGLTAYDRARLHHCEVAYSDVVTWRERLSTLTPTERLAVPGMVPGREDVLVAGLFILDRVMTRLGVTSLLTSEDDILDGVAQALRQDARRSEICHDGEMERAT